MEVVVVEPAVQVPVEREAMEQNGIQHTVLAEVAAAKSVTESPEAMAAFTAAAAADGVVPLVPKASSSFPTRTDRFTNILPYPSAALHSTEKSGICVNEIRVGADCRTL